MAIYELTKTYRGGQSVFYIEIDRTEKITDEMLESIGDNTNGGQESGYRIDHRRVRRVPKNRRLLPRRFTQMLY